MKPSLRTVGAFVSFEYSCPTLYNRKMDPSFWNHLWQTNDIKFHKIATHPLLIKFSHKLKPGRTIVPLCGKSLDMIHLWQEGHYIVGIEQNPIPCEAFFKENNIRFEKKVVGDFTIYSSHRLEIWCGDVFQTPPQVWKGMTGIYDRAGVVGFPVEMQKQYMKFLNDRMKENKKTFDAMLLITVDFDDEKIEGPPFSISDKSVKKLFPKSVKIEKISSTLDPSISGRAPKFSSVHVQEKVFLIKP